MRAPVITAIQPAIPTIPATDRSNSRIIIDSPRPSATSPSVANSCITLKIVPSAEEIAGAAVDQGQRNNAPARMVNGRADGA